MCANQFPVTGLTSYMRQWLYVQRTTFFLSPTTYSPMSRSHPTVVSPNLNFQRIFNSALKAYEKRTKFDLLSHPLAAELQACDSPCAILDVINQKLQRIHQSQSADERLTRWLNPTINVLYAFSATVGQGIGLVCLWT
jgi:hypothetical protein